MVDPDDVCVVIPTYDEAETIGDVVDGLRTQGLENVLVVDGHSTDGTRDVAREHGARIHLQTGTGKGQAVREAFAQIDSRYVLMLDGDGTYRPEDAERMLAPLDEGYDQVIGDRFADMRPGAMSRLNRVGNRVINRAFGLIHGEHFGDILSGYRAFTREAVERMDLTADGFGIETEMAVEGIKQNLDVAVVPVTYTPRPAGSETNLRPFRDGAVIFLQLYLRSKTNNPLFYFGSLGALSFLFGVGVGGYVGVEWVTRRVSHEILAVVAAVAIIFGVQLLMFGVLSDLILTLHRELLRRLEDD